MAMNCLFNRHHKKTLIIFQMFSFGFIALGVEVFLRQTDQDQVDRKFEYFSRYGLTKNVDDYLNEFSSERYSFENISRIFKRILGDRNFDVTKLMSLFRNKSKRGKQWYYEDDVHWNHEQATRYVLNNLHFEPYLLPAIAD